MLGELIKMFLLVKVLMSRLWWVYLMKFFARVLIILNEEKDKTLILMIFRQTLTYTGPLRKTVLCGILGHCPVICFVPVKCLVKRIIVHCSSINILLLVNHSITMPVEVKTFHFLPESTF